MSIGYKRANANDTGDWLSNKEMNPAAESSATENGLLESEEVRGIGSWRSAKIHDDEDQGSKPEAESETANFERKDDK